MFLSLTRGIIRMCPARLFLAVAIPFGLLTVFITPPLQEPDGDFHFASVQAYTVFPWRADLDKSTYDFCCRHSDLPFHPERKYSLDRWRYEWREASVAKTASGFKLRIEASHMLMYPVQVPVVALAKVIGVHRPVALLMLGRLTSLTAYILLVYWSIRLIPVMKWGLTMLALMPMTLFLGASLTHDAITIGAAFLASAWSARLLLSSTPVSRGERVGVWIAAGLLALCKPPYAILLLPLVLVSRQRLGSATLFFRTGIVLIAMASTALHMLPSRLPFDAGLSYYDRAFAGENRIDGQSLGAALPRVQISMTKMLYEFPEKLVATLTRPARIAIYAGSFIGCLGWLDTLLPPVLLVIYYLVMANCVCVEGKVGPLPWRLRMLFLCVGIGLFTGLHFFFYYRFCLAGWTGGDIPGIQGRYLIPVAPWIMLGLLNRSWPPRLFFRRRKRLVLHLVCIMAAIGIQIASVTTLIQRYYYQYEWDRAHSIDSGAKR